MNLLEIGSAGRSSRADERSLAAGIGLSLAVHGLVAAALIPLAWTEERSDLVAARGSGAPVVNVVLLPGFNPPSPNAREAPHVVLSTAPPSSVRNPSAGAAVSRGITTTAVNPPPPSATATPISAADGAPAVISPQPAGFDFAAGSDYRHRLLDHIATYRRTAPFARGDLSGTVMVRFSLDRRGNVQEVSIAGSSGVSELDEEAVATIWRAQPMPPIPAVLPEVLSVTFPMWFGTAPRAPG